MTTPSKDSYAELTDEQLIEHTLDGRTRAYDELILRQKLGEYAGCIGTERGVGYYFNHQTEEKK